MRFSAFTNANAIEDEYPLSKITVVKRAYRAKPLWALPKP